MKNHLIFAIFLLHTCLALGQNKGIKVSKSETTSFDPKNVKSLTIELQGAHIKLLNWDKYEIEINITKETSHANNESVVKKEEGYLQVYKTLNKNNLTISNNIVLPSGVKEKPQAKHVTYVEIKLPNIDYVNVDLNVGSLTITQMHIKSNIQAVLSKTSIISSDLQGRFRQKLGDLKIINSKLNGPYHLDYVVTHLQDVYGKHNLNANDSKIKVQGKLENFDGTWQLNRSELNYITSLEDLMAIHFTLKGTELSTPSFLPQQRNKTAYNIIPKSKKGKLQLNATNSFINIYNN